ncbi:MAG: hypothetical protein GX076_01720 [Clostridiales bacterium]|nr:hypothetical protein [Clostridiales bacterium]
MKELLYLQTQMGNILIEDEIVRKYNIKKGMLSPFTGYRIVDEKGEYTYEPSQQEELLWNDIPRDGFKSDGIDLLDNGFEFSTSEIIDFVHGTDSD